VPVLGTVLIIIAGSKAWVNRTILSNKVAVWFGLISFPLYLWHWPLLSFTRIVEGEVPSRNIRIAVLVLSVVLAWLTYKLVERPLRFGKYDKAKVAVLVTLMTIIGYVGYNTYQREGLTFRFNRLSNDSKSAVLKIFDAWRFSGYPRPENFFGDPKTGFLRIGNNEQYKILFIGDSHAEQYWNSISNFTDGLTVEQRPSVLFADLGFPSVLSNEIIDDPTIKVYVFTYYWSYKYGSSKVNQAVRCCGGGANGSVGLIAGLPIKNNEEMDAVDAHFLSILERLSLKKKRVIFILDNPFGEEVDPHAMLLRSWNGFKLVNHQKLSKSVAIERTEPVRSRIIRIAKLGKAEIIDPFQFLCNENFCAAFSPNGDLLYKDYDHLSLYTSRFNTSYLAPVFQNN
jgi:hypothetical protein